MSAIDSLPAGGVSAGRKWSKRDVWKIMEMTEQGKTNKEIGEHFGVSPNRIAGVKREKGIPTRAYRKWRSAELAQIHQWLLQGKSISTIADMLHVRYNALERCIRYHELGMRA